jgi:hypothetical protein
MPRLRDLPVQVASCYLVSEMERVLGPWQQEEDELLSRAIEEYGTDDWKAAASLVPSRTNKACRKVVRRCINPLSSV